MAGLRKILTLLLVCYINCGTSEYLRLREGGKCFWKGLNGTCVLIHQCPGLGQAITDGTIQDFEDVQAICAYRDKEPIICCRDCYIDASSNSKQNRFNSHLGTLRKTGEKANDQFIDYLDKLKYPCKLYLRAEIRRYVAERDNCYEVSESYSRFHPDGVTYVRERPFLHTAVLGYGENWESAQWLCGGSIISENYILTSANCTSDPQLGPVKFVAMGIFNTTDPADKWQRYSLKRIITHPEYKSTSKYHDIALLETEQPIVFTEYVLPSSIFTDNDFDRKADAISWRTLGRSQNFSEILDSVYSSRVTVYDELECSLLYPPQDQLVNGYNHTIQMCYGYKEKPSDPCEGDNGGPLQIEFHTTTCSQTVLGVTSFSRTCGEAGGAGLYTRVRTYIPWIENIVWP